MHPQLSIDFTSKAPINKESLTGQNRQVYDWLQTMRINTVFAREHGVYNLQSRISHLRNQAGVVIYDRYITIGGCVVKEYSLEKFDKK